MRLEGVKSARSIREFIANSRRLRERWVAGEGDAAIKSRVAAMAYAAAGSLQAMSGGQLVAAAEKYSIALDAATAQGMADYFEAKRNAVLAYNS